MSMYGPNNPEAWDEFCDEESDRLFYQDLTERFIKSIFKANKNLWTVNISFDCDEIHFCGYVSASRGDGNCPYRVTYHPNDGHGSEYVDDKEFHNFDSLITIIEELPPVFERTLIAKHGLEVLKKKREDMIRGILGRFLDFITFKD